MAAVGPQMPFKQGRDHIRLLADLDIAAKEVERTAEAIGEDIAVRQNEQIQQARAGHFQAAAVTRAIESHGRIRWRAHCAGLSVKAFDPRVGLR